MTCPSNVDRPSDYCAAAIVAERVAGGEYPSMARKYGLPPVKIRNICYHAVAMGLVTPEQIRRRVVKVTKLTDDEYIEMYRAKSIVTPDGCVLWQGWCQEKGYGQTGYRNKSWMIHRLIYTLKVGPIPPGMLVCHTCDRRNCWNHEHLFLGTEADNNRDCGNKGRHHNSVKTHCKHGHEFTPENTSYKTGPGTVMRVCKTCQRIRMSSEHYRQQAAIRAKRKRQAKRFGEQHVG